MTGKAKRITKIIVSVVLASVAAYLSFCLVWNYLWSRPVTERGVEVLTEMRTLLEQFRDEVDFSNRILIADEIAGRVKEMALSERYLLHKDVVDLLGHPQMSMYSDTMCGYSIKEEKEYPMLVFASLNLLYFNECYILKLGDDQSVTPDLKYVHSLWIDN